MSVIFSDTLVDRYQEYMQNRYGIAVSNESAQRELEQFAELFALFTISNQASFPCPYPLEGQGKKAD